MQLLNITTIKEEIKEEASPLVSRIKCDNPKGWPLVQHQHHRKCSELLICVCVSAILYYKFRGCDILGFQQMETLYEKLKRSFLFGLGCWLLASDCSFWLRAELNMWRLSLLNPAIKQLFLSTLLIIMMMSIFVARIRSLGVLLHFRLFIF